MRRMVSISIHSTSSCSMDFMMNKVVEFFMVAFMDVWGE